MLSILKSRAETSSSRKHLPTVIEELCHRFSLDDLRKSTNNFDDRHRTGNSSTVYKGCLELNGVTNDYALKQTHRAIVEFKNEIEVFCQLNHPNLVSLIGFCDHKDEKIIVYEYVSNGSLDKHLGDWIMEPLISWKKRLEICIGTARGLHYLHSGAKRAIFHRNISFSLYLKGPHFRSKPKPVQVDTIEGTIGYLDPEYFNSGTFTDKSDVYSFGMVLLKVVGVMEQTIFARCPSPVEEYIYPSLKGKIAPECWKIFMDVVKRCLKSDRNERPIIGEVELELEHALSFQEEADIRNGNGCYALLFTTFINERGLELELEQEGGTHMENFDIEDF